MRKKRNSSRALAQLLDGLSERVEMAAIATAEWLTFLAFMWLVH